MPSAYLTIVRISGEPDELLSRYRRSADTMSDVGRDHGLLLHAAAPADDGLIIVNLWPSREASEDAARDPRRQRVAAEHRLDLREVRRDHYDVADWHQRASGDDAFTGSARWS
jgi:hypothetical protein